MRTLHLMRHAKSDWSQPELDDIDRVLAPRGRRAAAAMADHITSAGVKIDAILCSPAVRTGQTIEPLRAALGDGAEVTFVDRLYGAGAAEVLATINAADDEIEALLVVGHNPATGTVAQRLAGPDSVPSGIAEKFPTGALASFESAAESWAGLDEATTTLTAFIRPRDL